MITTQRNLRRDQARGKFRCESNRGANGTTFRWWKRDKDDASFPSSRSCSQLPEFWIFLLSSTLSPGFARCITLAHRELLLTIFFLFSFSLSPSGRVFLSNSWRFLIPPFFLPSNTEYFFFYFIFRFRSKYIVGLLFIFPTHLKKKRNKETKRGHRLKGARNPTLDSSERYAAPNLCFVSLDSPPIKF